MFNCCSVLYHALLFLCLLSSMLPLVLHVLFVDLIACFSLSMLSCATLKTTCVLMLSDVILTLILILSTQFMLFLPLNLITYNLYTSLGVFANSNNNHTFPSTIRAVICTLTCTSMASISTSDSGLHEYE